MSDDIDILEQLINWRTVHLAHGGKLFEAAAAEIKQLREAIRRLAAQDATLSVCDGNVTVTLDATLTDGEREAIEAAALGLDGKHSLDYMKRARQASTLRKLLERLA